MQDSREKGAGMRDQAPLPDPVDLVGGVGKDGFHLLSGPAFSSTQKRRA